MEEIAQVYARALFEVAQERGVLDVVREQLGQFVEALDANRELAVFLFSPYFSTEEKKEGLRRAVLDAEPSFMNFLEALLERHRMPAIFRIRARYEELWDEENRLLPVSVTSAIELDEGTVASIGERIGESTGRQVELSSAVDPDILGGIVLRVGNLILDASIRNRLEQLRKQVAQA
ncbi:MAG: ATP synthase F1 subunit delta [Solirubrobacterales bacterium]|nr:ATP synthase F1 subunit delta [Solirubrobacterales bacterium]MBV9424286.1 ATP synthase F1 subunit delta [Solirubrobacterales bacterium]MBV9799501.1 ATP synthase F1 subunit delta [Solirubrobacterales bacterium]